MNYQSRNRRPAVRRIASVGVASALAASVALSAAPVAAMPAAAAAPSADVGFVDRSVGGYDPYRSYGWYGSPYASQQLSATAGLDVSDASATQSSGVVQISTVLDFGQGAAAGTGIVVDGADGIVVTNHHVVEGSTGVEVTVAGTEETYVAEVLGTDATRDVAVLRLVDAPTLAEVTTNSAALSVGDTITAVGDAGGDGGSLTAAEGSITDVHEPVTVTNDDGTETTLRNLVEVDADIISGDSGGALLDANGDVVGVNVAASSGMADITGYAIPVRRVLRIADAVLAGRESDTVAVGYDAFLGVQLATANGSTATLAGTLEGGAAAEAGLAAGDTMTSVDGTSTPTAAVLRRVIASHEAGETVRVTWTNRDGGTTSASVALGRAPIA